LAWERGDYSSTEWADPEVEYVIADGPAPGSWKGIVGMTEGWRELVSAWQDASTAAEDFRELDAERVLVLVHRGGRGRSSGVELTPTMSRGAAIFHLQAGKVTTVVVYIDRARALADLGLKE
jgi:ketosteroid isomerase-like protein